MNTTILFPSSTWQPTATNKMQMARAALYAKIRDFFSARGIIEVDTPLLSYSTTPDHQIHSLKTEIFIAGKKQNFYLQTSPEFAMKRLLANGAGAIYQICKAFRADESGRWHNPEFTILEWYHPGFDHHALMNEMDDFLQSILGTVSARRVSYCDLFLAFLEIDPLEATISQLKAIAQRKITGVEIKSDDKDVWLNLLMSHGIEPFLGQENQPVFVYDYPVTQAALARTSSKDDRVAERFEVYFKGVELANGFHELSDDQEQRKRFQDDLAQREKLNLLGVPLDENFLAALKHGLPDCAGVALGVDRLLMLLTNAKSINEVIAFPIDRA